MIHDAARPFVAPESIQRAIAAAAEFGAATVGVPCVDTILATDAEQWLCDAPDRRFLWACQTPQVFRTDVIHRAHEAARNKGIMATDDATLVRRLGCKVKVVMGTPLNLKITTPLDLQWAVWIIEKGLA